MQKIVLRNMALAIAVIVALFYGANQLSQSDRIDIPQAAPQTGEQTSFSHVVWSHGRDGTARNAEEHWEKHGAEFPEFRTALEYERGALAFVTSPPPGTLTKRNDRGDTLFYDPASNTFAVRDAQGEPRTFFRPNNGRAYWDRQ